MQSSSQHLVARRSSSYQTKIHIRVTRHVIWRQKSSIINHYICNATNIFFTALQNLKLVTALRGTSQLFMPHECAHPLMWRDGQIFQLLHLFYDINYLPQFKIQISSQHRTIRRSSSCHTSLHMHVSIRVMWRQKYQSLHLKYNIYIPLQYEIQSSSQPVAALHAARMYTSTFKSSNMWRQKCHSLHL
jgi:hypothetical protein